MNLIKTPFGFRSTAAEVAAFTAAWDGPLHILVANAGAMATPEQYTQQGWEWHDALAADGPVVFDDVDFVLFAVEATRRWAGDGITANALMPGAIYTNLQRHTGGRYFADCNETGTIDRRGDAAPLYGVALAKGIA